MFSYFLKFNFFFLLRGLALAVTRSWCCFVRAVITFGGLLRLIGWFVLAALWFATADATHDKLNNNAKNRSTNSQSHSRAKMILIVENWVDWSTPANWSHVVNDCIVDEEEETIDCVWPDKMNPTHHIINNHHNKRQRVDHGFQCVKIATFNSIREKKYPVEHCQ